MGFLSEAMLKILVAGFPRRSWCSRVNSLRFMQEVRMVLPSLAWVGEVETRKQGDIHIGRGSKQRGLLTSLWANRYKVSKFGRDRAAALHRAEVREDPQYGRRVHELSGTRLLCHCRQNEKCHADNPPRSFPRSASPRLRSEHLRKTTAFQ